QIVMATRPQWSQFVDRWIKQVRDHDRHLTYAENIYGDDCRIPRVEIDWRPTRCVVTLAPWSQLRDRPPPKDAAFSTIMTWNYFGGALVYEGVQYDQKVSEYEKFHDLPRRTSVPLALAVGGFKQPVEQIKQDCWRWTD